MALRTKRFLQQHYSYFSSSPATARWISHWQSAPRLAYPWETANVPNRPGSQVPMQRSSSRHLNFLSVFNKEAVAREKERLKDELNRGYFDDFKELKQTGGKMGMANRSLLPISTAVQFPRLVARTSAGATLELPPQQRDPANKATPGGGSGESEAPTAAALVCITFRASGQPMVESWSGPFRAAFSAAEAVHLYEVSMIESWLLSLPPVRELLLRSMRRGKVPLPPEGSQRGQGLAARAVYVFGDQWDVRKALGMTNRLTAYAFLLDDHGRVRWRASGQSSEEEIKAMLACTNQLLNKQAKKSSSLP